MENSLPAIPAKRYFTIGEVSDLCGVKPYVLRYWEQEFIQLKPVKRRGNRRYYQHHEVLLIRRIRELLYDQGFTISGARNQLGDNGHGGRSDAGIADRDPALLDGGSEFDDEGTSFSAQSSAGAAAAASMINPVAVTNSVETDAAQFNVLNDSSAAMIPVSHSNGSASTHGHRTAIVGLPDSRFDANPQVITSAQLRAELLSIRELLLP
jgi:DNA-binding transcriptional MerR regulator